MAKPQTIPLSALKLNDGSHGLPKNPRFIRDERFKKLVQSIKEFPEAMPARGIVVDERGVILGGNMRYRACRELGMETIPSSWVRRLDGLTMEQKRRFIIMDNRGFGEDDMDMLANEWDMDELIGAGFDEKELLGVFEQDEAQDAEPQVDRAEELNERWAVKPGDLWAIGGHRLLCGDSTKAADVARVMGGKKADLCFTSPPYGQQRDYTEEGKVSDWDALMRGVFGNLPMTDAGQVLVNLGMIHSDNEWLPYWDGWIEWMRSQGWRRFALYVWDQMHGLRGDWAGRFAPSHEFIFHFNKIAVKPDKWVESLHAGEKGGALRNKDGGFSAVTTDEIQPFKLPDSVWRVQRQKGGIEGHPAPFSAELPSVALRSWPGVAYEPFLGSGTTMVAAQNLGRKCYGIEIAPGYCAVILERMITAFPTLDIHRID